MVESVKVWSGECEGVMVRVDEMETTLANQRPLAGSVPIVTQQKEQDEV